MNIVNTFDYNQRCFCFLTIVTYNPLIYNRQLSIMLLGGLYMIKKTLGARIRELRKKSGFSQEHFALMIDMDRTYLASVESGKRNISLENIKKIADGFGISLSELFNGLK